MEIFFFVCYRGSASAVGSSVNMSQRNPAEVLSNSQMGTGRFMLDKVIKIWDVSSVMKNNVKFYNIITVKTLKMFEPKIFEPLLEKTNILHMRKQRRRSASR